MWGGLHCNLKLGSGTFIWTSQHLPPRQSPKLLLSLYAIPCEIQSNYIYFTDNNPNSVHHRGRQGLIWLGGQQRTKQGDLCHSSMPASTDYNQNPRYPKILQEHQHELAVTILSCTSRSLGGWQVWSILGALVGQDP